MKYQASYAVTASLEQLGDNLAAARRRRGLSQSDLATRAGVSRDTVYRAEHGRSVSTEALAGLLMVLGALDDFSSILSLLRDPFGRALVEQSMPTRVRRRRRAPGPNE